LCAEKDTQPRGRDGSGKSCLVLEIYAAEAFSLQEFPGSAEMASRKSKMEA